MSTELMQRLKKPGKLSLIVLGYLACAIVANALWWHLSFDDWMLERRKWDYGWELMLPWAARQGRWVGRELAYPIGPLWQALATLPTLGSPLTGPRVVAGLHLVFPLASIAVCTLLVLSQPLSPRVRAAALLGMSVFALHDDVRTFRAILPLAVVVYYAAEVPRQATSRRRDLIVGGLVTVGVLLSFDTGLLSLASLVVMCAYEAFVLAGGRPALARGLRALAAIAVWQLIVAGVLALLGGSYGHFVKSSVGIVHAYGTTMVLAPTGFDPAAAIAFVILATLLSGIIALLRVEPVIGTWLVGALPLAYRTVLRADAEHLYAGLVPLAAVLVLVCARTLRRQRFVAAFAGLLSLVFGLAWFGSHRDRPSAWEPTRFVALYRVLRAPPRIEYQGEFARLRRWVEANQPEAGGCIGLPGSAESLHALTGVPGPTELMLGWSEPLQRAMADRIREKRCTHAAREIISFDGGSWGFSDIMLAQHELYEPKEMLGPDLVASVLREVPVRPKQRPLFADLTADTDLTLPARVSIPFGRRVPWENAVRLEYSLGISPVRLLLGGAPILTVRFFDGDEPLSRPMSVPYAGIGENLTTIVPVVADVAEWRWVAGRAPKTERYADRMVISVAPRPASPRAASLRIHGLTELAPGDEPRGLPKKCEAGTEFARSHDRAMPRWTSPITRGDDLELRPNAPGQPLAEMFLPTVPCEDTCFFGQLSVAGDEPDAVVVEAHIIDGYDRPRVVHYTAKPGEDALPIELPLAPWAGRDVVLRLGVSAQGRSSNRGVFRRPRLGACSSLVNLALNLHRGEFDLTHGKARVSGAGLVMQPEARGVPPTEVLIPVLAKKGRCVALTGRREPRSEESAGAALDVGIMYGADVVRLSRVELGPDKEQLDLADLPLSEWGGRWVKLRLATWTLWDAEAPETRITRLRVHRCGDGAPWFEDEP